MKPDQDQIEPVFAVRAAAHPSDVRLLDRVTLTGVVEDILNDALECLEGVIAPRANADEAFFAVFPHVAGRAGFQGHDIEHGRISLQPVGSKFCPSNPCVVILADRVKSLKNQQKVDSAQRVGGLRMKTSAEQCLELSRRLGDRLTDRKAMLAELRRMGAEQRLAALQKRRAA